MPTLYTIGYGNRNPTELFDALTDAGIDWVIDVRLKPGARLQCFRPGDKFMGKFLEPTIGYKWIQALGSSYGDDLDAYRRFLGIANDVGKYALAVLVDKLEFVSQTRVCLLCCERDATKCHRAVIAEEALTWLNDVKCTPMKWRIVHLA